MRMPLTRKALCRRLAVAAMAMPLLFLLPAPQARAADHRDSPTAEGAPEGDITDFFAFLDPNNSGNLVLILNVNPFSLPAEMTTYVFSNDYLYQFKVDTVGNGTENQVIQVRFQPALKTECPSGQGVLVYGPAPPVKPGATNSLVTEFPTVTACTGSVVTQNGVSVFAGVRDDPFVFDFGQFARIMNGSQDVFRGLATTPLGPLRGRSVHTDGTSGVDAVGGFNVSSIAVELPVSFAQPPTGSRIGIWSTVGAPASPGRSSGSPREAGVPARWTQFQRAGHQVLKTVFIPGPQREAFNSSIPQDDMQNWSNLIPKALNSNDPGGNTPAARYQFLNSFGVFTPGQGAPALLPQTFFNSDSDLLRKLLLPDELRLDLNLAPTTLSIGTFGLQNGRRPGDDALDIMLRVVRQLADIDFAGSGRPGALQFNPNNLATADRRVFIVLEGTDFIRPDSTLGDLSQSGNDRPFLTTFPFLATPHPLPGDNSVSPGTVGFPAQQ